MVPGAKRVDTLTYEETQELAESGAKVLNAQAVEFAKEKGIAINARATASALPGSDPSSDGTVVRRDAPRMPGTVPVWPASATSSCFRRTRPMRLIGLSKCGVSGKQLHVAGFGGRADGTTLVISRENLHNEDRARDLSAAFGETLRSSMVWVRRVLSVPDQCHVPERAAGCKVPGGKRRPHVRPGHVVFSRDMVVKRDRLNAAVRQLHAVFIER